MLKQFSGSLLIFLSAFIFSYSQKVLIPWPAVTDSSDLVDTHSRPVEYQIKRTFRFPKMAVSVSNEFQGARLNELSKINDSTLSALILPENYPVNMSPWYSFKVWGDEAKNIYFKLNYRHGRQRYYPKVSRNGIFWEPLDSTDFLSSLKDSSSFFRIHVDRDTLWVSAQELMTSKWVVHWIDKLAEKPFISKQLIGYSTLGKPLLSMIFSESKGPNMLVVLSRQHPPEVTGFREMNAFVETLAGNSRVAKKFRKNFTVLIVPMMNPDGVDNGHWRHSAGGVDLNRDWRFFNQPETSAFRQFVLKEIAKRDGKVWFGVDFHSTQTDLFYLPDPKDIPSGTTISRQWINAINSKIPDHPFSPEPSGVTGQVSKNWFLHELKTEAITYEVGDNTDREVIRKRGTESALLLMEILLKMQ